MRYKNLVLIGTSHIAPESVQEVANTLDEEKPALVAIELDQSRLQHLFNPQKPRLKDIRHVGITGYLFAIIGAWAEEKLGKQTGTKPGDEMRYAVRWCSANKVPLSLIDQDIGITLKKLSSKITFKEKFRFVIDIIKGLLFRKPIITFDLATVPDQKVIHTLTKQVKERYPNVYEVLIKERNEYMAKKLSRVLEMEGTVVAIIGAGHEKEMVQLIKGFETSNRSSGLNKRFLGTAA